MTPPRYHLFVGHVFDRRVGPGDTGVKKDEDVNAGDGGDPEKEKRQGAQLPERIPGWPVGFVEQGFEPTEAASERVL